MATHTERLYSALTNDGFDVGDSANFIEAMRSPERRRKLYESASEAGRDLGDFQEFETKISSDFAPAAPPPPPARPADPEAARVREILKEADPNTQLDPANIGGPILSAAPVPAKRTLKLQSRANEELDKMFQAALARGEKYLSVEDYVRRKLTGETRSPDVAEDPGANVAAAFSGLRRSKLWRPIETAAKIPINALLAPERIAPAAGESIAGSADVLTGADLFKNIQAQVQDVEEERQRAAIDRVNAQAQTGGAGTDATFAPAMRQASKPGVAESIAGLVAQVRENPGETTADLLGSMITPENVAAEILTSNPVVGAARNVARSTRIGSKVGRLVANPLEQAGLAGSFSIPGQLAREVAQGAAAEYLGTGDVTAQGTVENLVPAIAGTPVARAAERILSRKPKTAIAPGGETIGAAARTTSPEPPPSLQEPAPAPAAPEPVPTAPEPVALPAAPAAPEAAPPASAPEPVQDMTALARQPKMSPAMVRASKLATKENKALKSDAAWVKNDNLKMAMDLAKRGRYDEAKAVITKTREQFDIVSPGLADDVIKAYHAVVDDVKAKADAKVAKKPRVSKMAKPKTEAEATAVVEQAAASGNPEQIEAARPAVEAMHPVGDDADKVIEEMKAQAEIAAAPEPTPTPEPIPEPAPEPTTPVEAAAQEGRQDIPTPTASYSHPSETDWQATPLVASRSAASIWGNPEALGELRAADPTLATKVKRAQTTLSKRQNSPLGLDGEPAVNVLDQAEEILAGNGTTMDDYLDIRGSELDDFLKQKGLTREELHSAYEDSQATPKEQADFIRAAAAVTGDTKPMREAKGQTEVVLGAFGKFPKDPIADLAKITKSAMKAAHLEELERIGDHLSRVEEGLAQNPKWEQQHAAVRELNLAVREMDDKVQAEMAPFLARVRLAAEAMPLEAKSAVPGDLLGTDRYYNAVTDALEGKKVTLDEKQQALHDAIREAFDHFGKLYEQTTGNPMRSNWVPRVELQGRVNAAVKGLNEQIESDAGANAALASSQMTVDKARAMPTEIVNPFAKEAVDNYTRELESLFELKNGKVHLAQENGRPLVDEKAAYLRLIDEKGELDVFLPEIFEKKATPKDGKLEMEVVPRSPENQRDWTPEDLRALLRGEAIRLLSTRHDYDPDLPSKQSFHRRRGHWQTDGSLLYGRLMPYMGDSFYDRNPLNLAARAIPRQAYGLARWNAFGKDKSRLRDLLVGARGGPLTDAQLGLAANPDGTFRLADINDGPLYTNSLARSYEDVAMGYIRPFTPETGLHKTANAIGSAVRGPVLMRKFLTSLNNELDGLKQASSIGPEAVSVYLAQRLRVLGMQQESAGRRLGARAAKMVGAKDAAKALIANDPMNISDELAMTDAAMILGADKLARFQNQADRIMGSFALSTKGMSVAAHFTGQKFFEDMVHQRATNPKGFEGDISIPADDLRRTMRESALDEAATLLDANGFPKDKAAAKRLLELGRPFVSEFKSKMVDPNRPLFQPKALRRRGIRALLWMAMTPLALQVGAWADLLRAYQRIQRTNGAAKAKAVAEFLKRGTLQQASALAAGTVKSAVHSSPAAAGIGIGLALGAYPALLAGYAAYGDYEPDDQAKKAQFGIVKNAYQILWKRLADQGWADEYGETARAMETLGRTALAGQTFIPRPVQPDIMTEEEARAAGIQLPRQTGPNLGDILAPQVGAVSQTAKRSLEFARLGITGGPDARPLSVRDRVAALAAAAQPILPIAPSGQEYLGKDLKAWKNISKRFDVESMVEDQMKKASLEASQAGQSLRQSKIQKTLDQWMGSGKRTGTFGN